MCGGKMLFDNGDAGKVHLRFRIAGGVVAGPRHHWKSQQEGEAMKSLALITILAGALFITTGCATPGYTATERNQLIGRDADYDFKMASDDWDYLLLLRPPSHLTIWNVK
jgi:hypothetical protein